MVFVGKASMTKVECFTFLLVKLIILSSVLFLFFLNLDQSYLSYFCHARNTEDPLQRRPPEDQTPLHCGWLLNGLQFTA